MKSSILMVITAVSLPVLAVAQDKQSPGKSGDAVKNPPAESPGRAADAPRTPNTAEPGKASDAVEEKSPSDAMQREFKGPIISVDRDAKTITVQDAALGAHKLHINDSTKITHDGKAGSWENLKIGAAVQGVCRGTAASAHAESVNVNK